MASEPGTGPDSVKVQESFDGERVAQHPGPGTPVLRKKEELTTCQLLNDLLTFCSIAHKQDIQRIGNQTHTEIRMIFKAVLTFSHWPLT